MYIPYRRRCEHGRVMMVLNHVLTVPCSSPAPAVPSTSIRTLTSTSTATRANRSTWRCGARNLSSRRRTSAERCISCNPSTRRCRHRPLSLCLKCSSLALVTPSRSSARFSYPPSRPCVFVPLLSFLALVAEPTKMYLYDPTVRLRASLRRDVT